MHTFIWRCVRWLILPLACCFLAVVRADTITEQYSGFLGVGYHPNQPTNGGVASLLIFPGFNPSLGPLNFATVDWVAYVTADEVYTSSAPSYAVVPFTLTETATASLGLPFSPCSSLCSSSDSATKSISGSYTSLGYHEYDFGGSFDFSGELVIPNDGSNLTGSEKSIWTEVSLEVTDEPSASSDLYDTGDVRYLLSFTASITYDYTPTAVPEPWEIAFLPIAIPAVLWLKKSRRGRPE